jgi:hypothetical protein
MAFYRQYDWTSPKMLTLERDWKTSQNDIKALHAKVSLPSEHELDVSDAVFRSRGKDRRREKPRRNARIDSSRRKRRMPVQDGDKIKTGKKRPYPSKIPFEDLERIKEENRLCEAEELYERAMYSQALHDHYYDDYDDHWSWRDVEYGYAEYYNYLGA